MLDKNKYEYYKIKIENNELDKGEVQRLSDTYINILIQYYTKRKQTELRKEIQSGKRFESLFTKYIKKDLAYYIGNFAVTIKIFELLMRINTRQETFHNEMTALYEKAGVSDILNYLYKHPDSQHKIICERTGRSKSYLSQLLKELEEIGCVERYATGKRSFFSLTTDGQAFVKEKQQVKRNSTYDMFEGKYDFYIGDKLYVEKRGYSKKELRTVEFDYKLDRMNFSEVNCVGKY